MPELNFSRENRGRNRPRHVLLTSAVIIICVVTPIARAQDEGPWKALVLQALDAAGKNDYAKAEQSFLKALREAEAFGPQDSRVGTTLNSLGLVYRAEHKYSEAEGAYRRGLAIIEHTYPNSIDVANVNFNIATIMFDEGHEAGALPTIERALSIYEKLLGPASLKTAATLCLQGDAYRLTRRYAEAEGPLRRCAEIREKDSGLSNAELADAIQSLARVFAAEGKASAAEARYKLVEKIRETTAGITSPLLAEAMEEHAAILKSMARDQEAEKLTAMAAVIRKNQSKGK
jgi:tetratricopeptide (TPR) repeat protein